MATIRSSEPLGRHEDAGEDRARLVARGRAGDHADRLDERLRGNLHDLVAAGLGEVGEVLGPQRAQVEARGTRDHLDVLLGRPQLERHVAAGQLADDVEQQPGRQHDAPLAHDRRLERHAQGHLHVGGPQLDAPSLGGQLDAGERLDRAAGRGDPGRRLELREELVR